MLPTTTTTSHTSAATHTTTTTTSTSTTSTSANTSTNTNNNHKNSPIISRLHASEEILTAPTNSTTHTTHTTASIKKKKRNSCTQFPIYHPNLQLVVEKLLSHAVSNTQISRAWLENPNNSKLPENLIEFPGKLDHASCLCVRICEPALPHNDGDDPLPSFTSTLRLSAGVGVGGDDPPSLPSSNTALLLEDFSKVKELFNLPSADVSLKCMCSQRNIYISVTSSAKTFIFILSIFFS
jgi:hypothetical protein